MIVDLSGKVYNKSKKKFLAPWIKVIIFLGGPVTYCFSGRMGERLVMYFGQWIQLLLVLSMNNQLLLSTHSSLDLQVHFCSCESYYVNKFSLIILFSEKIIIHKMFYSNLNAIQQSQKLLFFCIDKEVALKIWYSIPRLLVIHT